MLGVAAFISTACVAAPGMSDTCPDGFGMAVTQTLFCADNENSAQIWFEIWKWEKRYKQLKRIIISGILIAWIAWGKLARENTFQSSA